MKITDAPRRIYRYAPGQPPAWTNGIPVTCHDELVPPEVMAANDAVKEQTSIEHIALGEIGALQAQLDAAKYRDKADYGRALADGKADPGKVHEAGISEQIEANVRRAEAATIGRAICVDRLGVVMREADTETAAKAYDAVVKRKLAECREHLAAAEAARNEANDARGMSRLIDAFPSSSSDHNGAATSAPDAWRNAVNGIGHDLKLIDESEPLCMIPAEVLAP